MKKYVEKPHIPLKKRVFSMKPGRTQADVDRANCFSGQIVQAIRAMHAHGRGQSKHAYKKAHGRKPDTRVCYAEQTARNCYKVVMVYLTWALDTGRLSGLRRWQDLVVYIQTYLDEGTACVSADTVHTDAAYLFKAFGVPMSDYSYPPRRREDVTKNRDILARFPVLARKYPELIGFCLCTGLRKGKELSVARGEHLRDVGGRPMLHVIGKGGLVREVPLIGDPADCALTVRMCRGAGGELIVPTLPRELPVHGLRAMYVCAQYLMLARLGDEIPKKERYVCRREYTGIVLDKAALAIISPTIGHRRLNVIVQSYLWPLLPWLRGGILASPLPGGGEKM